jgi:multiple sugar transport system permease protein
LFAGALLMICPLLILLAGATKSGVDSGELWPRFLTDDVALYRKHLEALFDERPSEMQIAYDDMTANSDSAVPPRPDRELVAAWREFCEMAGNQPQTYTVGCLDSPVSKTMPVTLRRFVDEQAQRHRRDLAEFNSALGTDYADWASVFVSPENYLMRRQSALAEPLRGVFWEFKARQPFGLRRYFSVEGFYKNVFLKAQYGRDITSYNRAHGTRYARYDEVRLTRRMPTGTALERADWETFVREVLNPRWIRRDGDVISIDSLDFQFADFLNQKFGTVPAHWSVSTAQRDTHYLAFLESRGTWRWEFLTRNYRTVWNYLAVHGRGLRTTFIYCGLAVLGALLVNPLAAYALSRHRLRTGSKVLLFVLATVAFPAMLMQVPVFLVLRHLGWLNTFAALVLPGLANGYSILMLKGFFDAVPRDLYESASLDGAGEWRTFWNITATLSAPILAVVALNTFAIAYANFLYALLTCQDQQMWTMMVWLYQLQQRSGPGVVYASLVIAAVPTFLVFLGAQNVIMRGQVIPAEN